MTISSIHDLRADATEELKDHLRSLRDTWRNRQAPGDGTNIILAENLGISANFLEAALSVSPRMIPLDRILELAALARVSKATLQDLKDSWVRYRLLNGRFGLQSEVLLELLADAPQTTRRRLMDRLFEAERLSSGR